MQYALITGASKGIGKSIAIELAKRGINQVLIARSEELLIQLSKELEKEHSIKALHFACDLTENDACEKVVEFIKRQGIDIHILVNNAGYGLWGNFHELSLNGQMNMMHLNMTFIVKLTYMLLPDLMKRERSYILNVASTAAHQAVPSLSVYSATKSFLLSFSRGIRLELKQSSVSVTCLCPGGTDTEFIARAGLHHMEKTAERFSMDPQTVALAGIEGMFERRAEVVPGFLNAAGAAVGRILPKFVAENVAASLYHKIK
jgi:short-subunit dehydrogenase